MVSQLPRLAVVILILAILVHAYYGFISAHGNQDSYAVPWPTCVHEVGVAFGHHIKYRQGLDHAGDKSLSDAMQNIESEQVRVGAGDQTGCVRNHLDLLVGLDGCFCDMRIIDRVPDIFGGHYGAWLALKGIFLLVLIFAIIELFACRRCKIQSFCKLWRRNLFAWKSKWLVDDEHVHREIVNARCHYAGRCTDILRPCVLVAFSYEAIRLNLRYPLQKFPSEPVDHQAYAHMKEELIGGFVLPLGFYSLALTILARTRPFPCTEALDWCNVALSAMIIWRYATLPAKWYTYYIVPLWVARVIQGLMLGNFKFSMLLQCLITISDILAFNALNLWRGKGGAEKWQSYVSIQVIMLPAVLCLLAGFQEVQRAQARLLSKARRADNASALANRLLSTMSDAVVHLDSKLCIAKPCPQFASLVLRSSADSALLGKPFAEFVQRRDQERFVNVVAAGRRGPDDDDDAQINMENASTSHVRVMHVHLLDARQSPFAVEIFAASFPAVDGDSAFYILGIKEEEADVRTLTAMSPQVVPTVPERSAIHVDTQSLKPCFSLQSHSIASSSLPDETSSTSSVGSWIDFGDVSFESSSNNWVCVDMASSDMNILQCSPAVYFKMPLGCEDHAFAAWFNEVDAVAVLSYLKAGDGSQPLKVSFMPWGLGHNYTASLVIAPLVSDTCQTLRVLFSGVKKSGESHGSLRRIVVRVRGLKLIWTPAVPKDQKVYNGLFKHSCLPLVNPGALEDELRACCAKWIAAKQAPFECPRELGVYALKPANRHQTLLPQITVTLQKFMDVAFGRPMNIDNTWAELYVSVRFVSHCHRSISL